MLPLKPEYNLFAEGAAVGPQPIKYSLKEMADRLYEGGKHAILNAGESAIPDVCAHIKYLRQQLSASTLNLQDNAVRAWVGVLATIAVSKLRNFPLTTKNLPLNGGDGKHIENMYRDALKGAGLLKETVNGATVSYSARLLLFNDIPIAVLDPDKAKGNQQCFCYPFSFIEDKGGMTKLPWFQPGKGWEDVLSVDLHYLSNKEKIAFVELLTRLKDGMIASAFNPTVDSVLGELGTDIIFTDTNKNHIFLDLAYSIKNKPYRPANLTAWRGALACVGMSILRSFKLEEASFLPQDHILNECLLGSKPQKTVLKVNGTGVGFEDDKYLIEPFYWMTDPPKDVPWFKNGEWLELYSDDVKSALSQVEGQILAFWFSKLAEFAQKRGLQQEVVDELFWTSQVLSANYGGVFDDAALDLINGLKRIPDIIKNVPKPKHDMPPKQGIFTDYLLLTLCGNTAQTAALGMVDGTNIQNKITINKRNYFALVPVRSSFTNQMQNLDDFSLSSLTMKVDGDSVTVFLNVNNGGLSIKLEQAYSKDKIRYCRSFPYLSLWPYIRSNHWNRYYVSWSDDILPMYSDDVFTEVRVQPARNPADYQSVTTYDKSKSWISITYKSFPEYVHVQTVGDGQSHELGAVYIKQPKNHKIGNKVCYAAIDFGTSNTIVRMMDEKGEKILSNQQPLPVFTNRYIKPLTVCEKNYFDAKDFHEFHWFPCNLTASNNQNQGHWKVEDISKDELPTVVQVYEGANQTCNTVPHYGMFLRSNCHIMHHFLTMASQQGKTLNEVGIRSNIKMSQNGVRYDGDIAIEMILLECALAATERDSSLYYVISYPDDAMWGNHLQYFWSDALRNAQQVCTSIMGEKAHITERLAAKWQAPNGATVNPDVGYCIIDIGGGTTDISLWRRDGIMLEEKLYGSISLKYAGNQITSESLYSFYRKLSTANPPRLDHFRALWDNSAIQQHGDGNPQQQSNGTSDPIAEYEQEMEVGFDNLNKKNLQKPADLKELYSQVPLLSTTLVSDFDFSSRAENGHNDVLSFRSLVRFKIASVFYILGRMIYLYNACDDSNLIYYISMAGNGSKALRICGDGFNAALNSLMKMVAATQHQFQLTYVNGAQKTVVVDGLCAYTREFIAAGSAPAAPATMEDCMVSGFVSHNRNDAQAISYRKGIKDNHWAEGSYEDYLEKIIKPLREYFPVSDLFGEGKTLYELLTITDSNNKNIIANQIDRIFDEVYEQSEPGTSLATVADIAAIKMADYLLFVHKFS